MITIKNKLLITSAIACLSIIAPALAMEGKQPTTNIAAPTDNDYTAMHEAAYNGDVERICELTDAGADLNAHATIDNGNTPLHLAVSQGHINAVIVLVTFGADPIRTNNDKQPALALAATTQKADMIKAMRHGLAKRKKMQPQVIVLQKDDSPIDEKNGETAQ